MSKKRKTAELDVWVQTYPEEEDLWMPGDDLFATRKDARRAIRWGTTTPIIRRARLIIDLESKG